MFSGERFAVTPGKDHDNYVVASFGDPAEMATELADWSPPTSIGHGQLGMRSRRGSRGDTEARGFRHHVRRRGASTVHGAAGLAPHIRALLPIRSGLTRKGREAGVRWRTLGSHSLSDNQ
jgi:hypothetical protein